MSEREGSGRKPKVNPKGKRPRARKGRVERVALPVLPLRNTVVFPGSVVPLTVGRDKSLRAVEEAVAAEPKRIMIFSQREAETEDPGPDDMYHVGTLCLIVKHFQLPDGNLSVIVQGLTRARMLQFESFAPYVTARVETHEEKVRTTKELEAEVLNLKTLAQKVIELSPNIPEEASVVLQRVTNPLFLVDLVFANLDLPIAEKQELLEIFEIKARYEKAREILSRQIEVLELSSKIQSQVKGSMDAAMRERFLREQMKAIRRELGDEDDEGLEIEEFRDKIEKSGMPEEARKEAERELARMANMPPQAAEFTVSRTYLQWLVELPWQVFTEDNLDIKSARKVLNEDHYDLEKVKRRILEYLAVRKLKPDAKGPILCFVGPPGVGKTSLGRSIARALGRKVVRVSLGGIRDEAEIRGHRRTYVGSLPGRVVQGIKKAGTKNPVFMLDEIDKVGMDFRGDPSSALLEVLDPEQNHAFSDHYLEVPFDLSNVMFIATANLLDPIPPALRDRLEVLRLPGYTSLEKLGIAKNFLIPKQVEEHGLTKAQIRLTDGAVQEIIRSYTRESGVRNLEREIAGVCRGVAQRVAEGKLKKRRSVTPADLPEFLGPIRFFDEVAERTGEPGIATGLAWTPTGGDVLFIEVTSYRGTGKLRLTGKLGEVMKESAQAALSFIRAHAEELKLSEEAFDKTDYHIHVPEGAIAKDGPSAGVVMFGALLSLMTGRPVKHDVAATGEITLRGKVLPVGGVKEKVIAAKRAGIRLVILPEWNKKDLEDIPDEVRKGLSFRFVSRMEEIPKLMFEPKRRSSAKSPASKKPAKKRTAAAKASGRRPASGGKRAPARRTPERRPVA
jgi:ATP-dependent Lon protease